MILPKTKLERIEKGKFEKIIDSLTASNFTGYVKVGFKKLELSSGEVLFDSGKIVAAEVARIKSKTSIYGDSAISELITLDNSVVEIYPLDPLQVKKAIEINQIAAVKGDAIRRKTEEVATAMSVPSPQPSTPTATAARAVEIVDRDQILKKYGIAQPNDEEIKNIILDAVGSSELAQEVEERLKVTEKTVSDRDKILEKYGIKRPKEEEIEFLISNALGIEEESEKSGAIKDFNTLKKELIELIVSKVGKPSKKSVSIIESCNSYEELMDKREELEKSLRSLVMFIPREKINMLIADIEEKIGRKLS
ncbi:MAG: DUF2226 domain-containing protein [Archaeoglobales archaeon]|nr:DUF2226 domain-containing protein [Archaeoglobales archaeon]